jgi:hypothetical protein
MTNQILDHAKILCDAELQFRLASAVRLASTLQEQPLTLPVWWSHGKHVVEFEEIALSADEADRAAFFLHRSATFLMASAIRNAIKAMVEDPKSADPEVRAAYQIARMIRNAFSHSPFAPVWSIDTNCQNQVFEVENVVRFDTTSLDGTAFDWRHYGGPLALFRLCQFVRIALLGDDSASDRAIPPVERRIYQQGRLILEEVPRHQDTPVGIKGSKPGEGTE